MVYSHDNFKYFFLRLHYFERAINIIDRRKASLLIYEQKRN